MKASNRMEHLLLSLKPHYAELVFQGLKGAELRRRIIPSIKNRKVYIYVSSPVRQVCGGFRVGEVWKDTPEKIWDQVSELAQIDKSDFDAYYSGRKIAYALQVTNVWVYKNPISLNNLRKRFSGFVVPQSWRYVRYEEFQSFQRMKRLENNNIANGCKDEEMIAA